MRVGVTTWRLWHTIQNWPAPSAPFKRVITPGPVLGPNFGDRLVVGIVVYYVALSVFLGSPFAGYGSPAFDLRAVAILLMFIPVGLLLVVISPPCQGIMWLMLYSNRLTMLHRTGVYPVLVATPPGHAGLVRLLGGGMLHQHVLLKRLPNAENPFAPGVVWPLLIVGFALFGIAPARRALLVLIPLLVGGVFLYIGYVQSCCLGTLLAANIPQAAGSLSANIRWATAGLLGIQAVTYGVPLYLLLYGPLSWGMTPFGMMGVPHLIIFYWLRELIIVGLWRWYDVRNYPEQLVEPDAPTNANHLA